MRRLTVFGLLFCAINCLVYSTLLSLFVIASWWGGPDGIVVLTFNQYHERLLESILFPTATLGGIVGFTIVLKYIKRVMWQEVDKAPKGRQPEVNN